MIVLGDDQFFAGEVNVAIWSRKQLHNDWDVTLGFSIRAFWLAWAIRFYYLFVPFGVATSLLIWCWNRSSLIAFNARLDERLK
jgi:hypothetical protein